MPSESTAYHHGQLRSVLLKLASQALEKGELPSLRHLAEQAGVSKTAPYRHFADKDALLSALAAQGFRDLRQALEADEPVDPLERLQAFGRAYLAFARRSPALYRLMFSAYAAELPGADCQREGQAALAILEAAVASAQAGGWRSEVPTALVTLGLWSYVHGLSDLVGEGLVGPLGEAEQEYLAGLFVGRA